MARFSAIRIPGVSKGRNMTRCGAIGAAALATTMLGTAAPCWAADVTVDRLINADREPQNWLMNHRTYDGQRFSPLARINKDNVKNLKLAYAVPLGGGAGNEWIQATPLAEDGFL
jgi:alcohol dehydrogenase (cytochrome c)